MSRVMSNLSETAQQLERSPLRGWKLEETPACAGPFFQLKAPGEAGSDFDIGKIAVVLEPTLAIRGTLLGQQHIEHFAGAIARLAG